MKRLVSRTIIMLLLIFGLTAPAQAQTYSVVDAGAADATWPQEVIGTYNESGTNDGRPCYAGPNGYWLYHTISGGYGYWFVGKPMGNTDLNHQDVRFYIYNANQTPPLNTNFTKTGNALGSIKVTTSGGSPPPAPGTVTSGAATATSFTCYWTDVSSATGYKIYVSTSSNFSSFVPGYGPYIETIAEGTPFANRPISHLVSGLDPGTTYYFRMKAYNGFGDSVNSNTASVTTIPGPPTAQPATNVNESGFRANWSSQSGANGYNLYVSTASNFSSHVINNLFVPTNYHDVTGLSPNTTYYYRVKATNTSGESGISGNTQVTTSPDKTVVQAATEVQANGFTANWQGSAGATGYYLDVATDSSFNNMVAGYSNKSVGNVTSYQVNQAINAYTTYYLRVRAFNTNGTSTNSNSVSVKTLPVMAVVTTVSVTDIGKDSALASGNITNLGTPGAGQHGFCWNTSGSPTTTDARTENGPAAGTGAFTSSLTGLQSDTPYYVRAYATNEAGTAYGQVLTFTTLKPNTAPTINGTAPSIGSTDEDTASNAIKISSFLDTSDPDTGVLTGIAINATTGNGTWQYSIDELSWSAVGTVSHNSALLLSSAAYVRYIPDGLNGETATITFRAWDQTSGTHGNKVDTTTNGGTTAFSTNTGTATLTITAVNDLPASSNKTVTTNEDTAHTFTSGDFNFADEDNGDSLQSVRIDTLPGVGSLTLDSNAVSAGGTISAADINAGKLKFTPAANANGAGYTSFTYSVNDGSAWSASSSTMTIDVTMVNDAPVVTAPAFITVTEDIGSTITDISFNDVDAGPVSVTATFTVGSGTLTAISGGMVTVGGTATTSLTLTGTIANINNFIGANNLTYTTAMNNTSPETLNISIFDAGNIGSGGAMTGTNSVTLNVTPVNDASVLDLDATNGGSADYATTYCAGGPPVKIANSDATIIDVDLGDEIEWLSAVLNSAPDSDSEVLSLDADAQAEAYAADLTIIYDADTRTLSIQGNSSPATYQAILRGIAYSNITDSASITLDNRTINVVTNDGVDNSNAVTSTLTVATAPVVDLNGVTPGNNASASYSEGVGFLLMAPDATVGDPDGDNLNQLVIQMTNPQDGAAESISLSGGSGVRGDITATYDSSNQITLSGSATPAQYQVLLQQELVYSNTSDDPNSAQRTITIQARDTAGYTGAAAMLTVTVIPVNDIPNLTDNTGFAVNEGESHTLTNAELRCTDPDNTAGQLTYTVFSGPVNGSLLLNGNTLPDGKFTQEDIDNSLIIYNHDGGETTSDSFTFDVSDGAGSNIGNTTIAITISPVNDTPVITTNNQLLLEGGSTAVISNGYLTVSDADNTPEQLTYTINTAPSSGTLFNSGSALSAGGSFTQADTNNNLITYSHDNSETTVDSFAFTVSDGAGGSLNANFNFSIEPTVINAGASGITVNPGAVPADGTSAASITAVVKNINGNPLAGHTITLNQGGGNSIISPESCVTNDGGQAKFTVKSNRAETVTYTAHDETDNKDITQTVHVIFEPGITVNHTSGSAVEGESFQYEVALVSQPTADVTISINHDALLSVNQGSLTFTDTNYYIQQFVTITAINNNIAEDTRTATVSHSVYSSDLSYNGMSMPGVTITIMDNDSPGISVIQSYGNSSVTEGAGPDSYSVVLNTEPADSVEISISSGSQLDVTPADLLFTTANWSSPQTVSLWAADDDLLEWGHTGTVSHFVYSADPNYNNYIIPDITAQIIDNDASSNAKLSGLKLSSGTLTPGFAPGTTGYNANVSHSVTNVTVTATPEDETATILINTQPVTPGGQSSPIPLTVGDNTVAVLVTAQDNSTIKEYLITVRRAASSHRNRDDEEEPSTTFETSVQVNAQTGGSVSCDNITVDIPAGSLPGDDTVSIKPLTPAEADNVTTTVGLRVKLASDIYEISTSGERHFGDNTITVKIAYDPDKIATGEEPVIHYYDETLARWVQLETEQLQEYDTWYAVTRVNHLTKFTVFSTAGEMVITLAIGSKNAAVNSAPYTLDAVPYLDHKSSRTLVPIRFVAEALGADVQWDNATRRVTITDNRKMIILTLDSAVVQVDGQAQTIDCAPVSLPPGRTFVPLRFVSETLGAQVDYDNDTKEISITR